MRPLFPAGTRHPRPAGLSGTASRAPRWWYATLGSAFVLAAAAQAVLALRGLYSVAADESERALQANALASRTAFRPDVWPPFYKVFVGLGLDVHRNLFVTPRVMSSLAGLAVLGALVFLAHVLFDDRRVEALTALLGVLIPHRLILSVAPMAEIYLYLFEILGAAFLLRWLTTRSRRDLTAAAVSFGLGTTVRFEAWFIAVAVALALAAAWACRQVRLSSAVGHVVILLAFPVAWVTAAALTPGGRDLLSITSRQAAAHGVTALDLVRYNPLYQFLRDLLEGLPLLAGLAAAGWAARRRRDVRWLVGILYIPMVVTTLAMVSTKSVAFAAPWRLSGLWTLPLLPFLALAVVELWQRRPVRGAHAGAVVLAVGAVVLFGARSVRLAGHSRFTVSELEAGRTVASMLSAPSDRILIEPTGTFSFLNVIVASNLPDRFVLTRGHDAVSVGVYGGEIGYWQEHAPDAYNRYLAPVYRPELGLDAGELACRHITTVMLESQRANEVAHHTPGLMASATFGPWDVYRVEGACRSPAASPGNGSLERDV